jgi:hypothetical protein
MKYFYGFVLDILYRSSIAESVKFYGRDTDEVGRRRFSPPHCVRAAKWPKIGSPNLDMISTSYTEPGNLTILMANQRYRRLTNAFSKTIKRHKPMLAVSMFQYIFARIHQTLRTTPAMAAGIVDHAWEMEEIADLCGRKGE